MKYVLHPGQLRRMSKPELKALAERCEQSLLSGLSTNQGMMTLIEVEKELLRRERIETRERLDAQQLDVRKTLLEHPPLPSVHALPNYLQNTPNPPETDSLEPPEPDMKTLADLGKAQALEETVSSRDAAELELQPSQKF
ncbi:MAG: hypothetical protein ACRCYY_21155 [Trueperaceae bacterium]